MEPQEKNTYHPQPRRSIHRKMATGDVKHQNESRDTGDGKHQNESRDTGDGKHQNESRDTGDAKHQNESRDTGDAKHQNESNGDGNDQQSEIQNVSNRNATSLRHKQDHSKPECEGKYSKLHKQDHFIPECNREYSKLPARKQDPQKAGEVYSLIGCLLLGFVVILIVYNSPGESVSPGAVTKSEREQSLTNDIQQIHNEFPSQLSNTWHVFSAGIKKVQETPTKPSVFLLLHETEEWTPACLAWKIGNISAHFLDARNPNPVVLDGANIENNQTLLEDYGILLEEYKPMVEERCAMIVKDLHKIPGIVAQSFHWFCDTEAPLVEKAVFLITLEVSGAGDAKDTPCELAEKELKRIWNGQIDEDKLIPLIARITDTVIMIMPERNDMSCPPGTIVSQNEHL